MLDQDTAQGSKKAWRPTPMATDPWVVVLTWAILGTVTSVVTAVVTAITIVFVGLGGLWLGYRHLPSDVFTILAAILTADILLGIAVRVYRGSR